VVRAFAGRAWPVAVLGAGWRTIRAGVSSQGRSTRSADWPRISRRRSGAKALAAAENPLQQGWTPPVLRTLRPITLHSGALSGSQEQQRRSMKAWWGNWAEFYGPRPPPAWRQSGSGLAGRARSSRSPGRNHRRHASLPCRQVDPTGNLSRHRQAHRHPGSLSLSTSAPRRLDRPRSRQAVRGFPQARSTQARSWAGHQRQGRFGFFDPQFGPHTDRL